MKVLVVLLCCNPPGVPVLPKFVGVLPNRGFIPKVVLPVWPNPVFPKHGPRVYMEVVLELPLNMEGVVV